MDRGDWYPYALKFIYETFGNRNRVERYFGYLKDRTKRFHNNVNTKNVASIGDFASAIAMVRNLFIRIRIPGDVIPS